MGFKLENHRELSQVTFYEDKVLGIMRWGATNSFPQTLLNFLGQSPNGKPPADKAAKFFRGGHFEGQDMIVNKARNLSLGSVVEFAALQLSYLGGFAIQENYNIKELVSAMTPLNLTDLRFNILDELDFSSKIAYHNNFGSNSEVKRTRMNIPQTSNLKWFNRFNPTMVKDQILNTKGGISNYEGQILYYSNRGHSKYPEPTLQAPINYVIADVENSILVRKETTTGFINTYVLKTSLSSEDENVKSLEDAIVQSQGSRGVGKVITFAGLPPEDISNTILEELASGGSGKSAIEASKLTHDLTKEVLTGAYEVPSILANVGKSGGISGSELADAYFIYNSITQDGRNIIEENINKILKYSDFPIKEIKLTKLKLDKEETDEQSNING